jgi:hypothetical protein
MLSAYRLTTLTLNLAFQNEVIVISMPNVGRIHVASKSLGSALIFTICQIPPTSEVPHAWFDIQVFGTFLILQNQFRSHHDCVPSLY